MNNTTTFFISHDSRDENIALELKVFLEDIFSNVSIFVSGSDIIGGQTWIEQLKSRLKSAKVIISLLTTKSVQSNWVYFESGAGFVEDKTIPLLTDNLKQSDLPGPYSMLQARLLTEAGLEMFIKDISKKLDFPREPKVHLSIKTLVARIEVLLRKKSVLHLQSLIQLNQIAPHVDRQWIYEENCLVHDFILLGGHYISLDTYFYIDKTEIQLFDRSGSFDYIRNTIFKTDAILTKPFNNYELHGERLIIQSFECTESVQTVANALSDILHRIDEYKISQIVE